MTRVFSAPPVVIPGRAQQAPHPLLTQGQIVPSMGQDPQALLARKLDFQRVIFKKNCALRALVRQRGISLEGGGRFSGTPQKTVYLPEPIVSRRVATTGGHPQNQTIVWFGACLGNRP